MKKALLLLATCLCLTIVHAQDSLRTYRNEFGIDATGFLSQFFHINSTQYPDQYYPTWYLTYRYHLKKGNIRAGIAGDYQQHKTPSPYTGDEHKYEYYEYNLVLRVGYEWLSEINKHWQVHYGVDLMPSVSYTKNDAPYFNGGYANGNIERDRTMGIAPLLGIRYRINKRMSLLMETSFSFNYSTTLQRKYFIPTSSAYPQLNSDASTYAQFFTRYNQPLSLFLTFDL